MLKSIILIEVRATEPAEEALHPEKIHTAVLLYGEDSLLCYTFTTDLRPILRHCTTVLTTVLHDYCTALQSSAVPPPLALVRLTKLPHVCLLHWLRGIRFHERYPGFLQIRGGAVIVARRRCALHVGRGGTTPCPVVPSSLSSISSAFTFLT